MSAAAVNQVRVDPDADVAALEAIAGEELAAEQTAQAELEAQTHDPEAWREASEWTVDALLSIACPAWAVEDQSRERLTSSLTRVLDHYMPGAIAGMDTWHPLTQLAAAIGLVTAAHGFDFKRLQFKPTHHAPSSRSTSTDEKHETPGRHAHIPSGDEPQRQDGKRVTLSG